MATRKSSFDKTLDTLRDASRDPRRVNLAVFRQILGAREHGFLVAEAARLARELELRSLVGDLEAALEDLLARPAKNDPGCRAKQGIVDALSSMVAGDPPLLLRACRHVQMEPSGPEIIDTAPDLRLTALRALAVQMSPEVAVVAAELLTDANAGVRAETAHLLADASPPGAEALLRLKILSGEHDSDVLTAAFSSLLKLDPARSLSFVTSFVHADDRPSDALGKGPRSYLGSLPPSGHRSELVFAAVLALGEARPRGAREVLLSKLATSVEIALVHHVMLALALLRDPAAIDALLHEIEGATPLRAKGAVTALAIYRHDETICDRVREIVARRAHHDISRRFREEFQPSR